MNAGERLVAFLWHQRTAPVDVRERLLAALPLGPDQLLLDTCHRVELYAVVPPGVSSATWLAAAASLAPGDLTSMSIAEDGAAAAHLFRVASGLDSAVAGEPQILSQVRRAYVNVPAPHPLLARLFERALNVGRAVRRTSGLTTDRSVGSLAVDEALGALSDHAARTVLVVGAGEMGKLAVRALGRRVGRVLVANRDAARASELADANGIEAVDLADVPAAIAAADAVISAADTRGALLTRDLVRARLQLRGLVIVDVAVPRSVAEDARGLAGLVYRSVDDLPGAAANVPVAAVAAGVARCAVEAERFFRESESERVEAIVALRARAEVVRRQKLARALRQLGHLTPRDRRIVEALSTTLTDALLYPPTIALRQEYAAPAAARALFGQPRAGRT